MTNSSDETDVTIESANDSTIQRFNDSTPSALACLKQLTKETHGAFSAFFLYATAAPTPSISAFAREHGFSRNTIYRWREMYRWEERLSAFNASRAQRFVEATDRQIVSAPAQAAAASNASVDFRAETLRLARHAIDTWLAESDSPITLQGLTRMLELASKFNPPPAPESDSKEDAAHKEFFELLDRAYGDRPSASTDEMVQNGSTTQNAKP